MTIDTAAYAKELMTEAGITDAEQVKQLEAFFTNDKVKGRLSGLIEGVDRERGRTAAEKQRADAAVKAQNDYYQEQLRLAQENQAKVNAATAEVQRYVELYGELPGGGNPNNPRAAATAVQNAIDQKALDEALGKRDALTVGLVKQAATITARHLRNFNEEPDFDAIEKIAIEKGLTAMKAYEEWAAPKVAEKSKAANDAATKAAIEAAVLEDRSKRGAGQLSDSRPQSEFMGSLSKSLRASQPSNAQDSFVKGWREPEPGKTMATEFGRR